MPRQKARNKLGDVVGWGGEAVLATETAGMEFLYVTDGSESALHAGRFLAGLPLAPTDTVTLLTVIQHEEGRADARPALEAADASLGASLANRHRIIRRGNAAVEILDAIVETAGEVSTDLITLGTRGLTGLARFLLGSTAERVAQFAPCSVLLAQALPQPAVTRILVGFDGSPGARRAVSFLTRLPLPAESEVFLTSVLTSGPFASPFLPPAYAGGMTERDLIRAAERTEAERQLAQMAQLLQESGRKVTVDIREGRDIAADLLTAAVEQGAELIVVGAQGASAFDRYQLGSVAERVIRHAGCSVLVVRAQQR